MHENATSRDFFERKYQEEEDPWDFRSSAYEQQRYELTIKALGKRRFVRAFEPGCSIGVLTERLAKICDRVEAIDISSTAVNRARERCRRHHDVMISQGALPDAMPHGHFDLIMFSEIGYYFDRATLADIVSRLVDNLSCGGIFLAAHWLGDSTDHCLSGDEVHGVLSGIPGLQSKFSERYEGFRLDMWSRV